VPYEEHGVSILLNIDGGPEDARRALFYMIAQYKDFVFE